MIKKVLSKIYRKVFNVLATYLPTRENVVLFESFNGKVPCDNPYYIYLKLKEERPEWRLYWGVKKQFVKETREKYPEIEVIKRFSLKWLFVAPCSKYWVMNARLPSWLKKNKQTVYIQTWHGTPLKKLGLDIVNVSMPNTTTEKYHRNFIEETSRWDALVAPNQYSEDIFRQAFQFKNKFLETGYPRNDRLINESKDVQIRLNLKNKLFGENVEKVILYAPTWRDDYFLSKGNYRFHMPFDLEKILSIIGKNDRLILRPHYLVGEKIDIKGYEKQVKICLNHDINDLYLVSDLLITDYSSVMFDFGILKRPMLFYAYDIEHYQEKLRGFYFNYEDVPGPIATTEESFYSLLQEFKEKDGFSQFKQKEEEFYNKFTLWEKGNAAKQIVEFMLKGN